MPEPFGPTHKAIIYDELSCTVRFTVALYCRVFELVPHGRWRSVVFLQVESCPILFSAVIYVNAVSHIGVLHLPSKTKFSYQGSDLFCNVLFSHISMCTVMKCGLQ